MNFKIHYLPGCVAGRPYYICAVGDNENLDKYLHRDKTVHNKCGSANFFETREEAEAILSEFQMGA